MWSGSPEFAGVGNDDGTADGQCERDNEKGRYWGYGGYYNVVGALSSLLRRQSVEHQQCDAMVDHTNCPLDEQSGDEQSGGEQSGGEQSDGEQSDGDQPTTGEVIT